MSDDDASNEDKATHDDMVTPSNNSLHSSSSSDSETETLRRIVRNVSFNDEPKIFIFQTSDPDSDSETSDEEDVHGEEKQADGSGSADDQPPAEKNESDEIHDGPSKNDHEDSPTATDVLNLQGKWELYETEKEKLEEMENRLAKRKSNIAEQEKELEEYGAYLERRHKSLTKKEEDLCLLQDELEDLSDLLKEKKQKIAEEEDSIDLSPRLDHETEMKEMKEQLDAIKLMERDLRAKLRLQEDEIQNKNEIISKLEAENEKLRGKMKRLESKLKGDMTKIYGSSLSSHMSSFSSLVLSIPVDEKTVSRSQTASPSLQTQRSDESNTSPVSPTSPFRSFLDKEDVHEVVGESSKKLPDSPDSYSSEYSMYLQPKKKEQDGDRSSDDDAVDTNHGGEDFKVEEELVIEDLDTEVEENSELSQRRGWALLKGSSINVTSKTCLLM